MGHRDAAAEARKVWPWFRVMLKHRSFTFGPGTVTGAMDFIQRQPRRFRVVARQRSRALCLERTQFDHIATALPEVCIPYAQEIIGQDSALSAACIVWPVVLWRQAAIPSLPLKLQGVCFAVVK